MLPKLGRDLQTLHLAQLPKTANMLERSMQEYDAKLTFLYQSY